LWTLLSRFTRATRRPQPCAGLARPSWHSGVTHRRRMPSQLLMRAPAKLPARFGTTLRQGWPGWDWRKAIPRLLRQRWSHCWRSAQGPATMKRRSKAWNSRAWSNGRVTDCWQRSATLAPPSGWTARTRRLGRRRRRSSTANYAKVSFATSRLTERSQRRGNAQRGRYHVSTHALTTDRLFDPRFRAV